MYEQVFQFNSRPFTATPYVKHYFAGDAIHNALGQARVCIDRGTGPVIVIGGTGTGKSLLLAMLEEQYQAQFNVVNLACARLGDRRELLQSVLFELQLPFKDQSETELRFSLIEYLKPSEQCPNGVLLLVDEGHSLSTDLLDELRLIMNVVRDGQPRVRLVMAGSQRLEETLNDPKLESFNQRIAARCYLQKMSRDETARYVTEHIDRAGGNGCDLFSPESLRSVHDVSEGCPRLVNQVCDQALILAATQGLAVISDDSVMEAWSIVQSIPGSFTSSNSDVRTSQVAELKSDESWTVIEFGQLEDEEMPSKSATQATESELACDWENECGEQDAESETTESEKQDDPDGRADPASASDDSICEDESLLSETTCFQESGDSVETEPAEEFEYKLQDAEEESFIGWAPKSEIQQFENDEQDSDGYDKTDELDSETVDSYELQTEAAQEAVVELNSDTGSSSEKSPGHDLAAELAAVFGDIPSEDTPTSSASIKDLEMEQDQIVEQVETEKRETFGFRESVASDGEDAAVAGRFPSESNHGDESDAELSGASKREDPASDNSTCEVSDEGNSTQVSSEFVTSENSETGAEDSCQNEELDDSQTDPQPQLRQPVETVDPFSEAFDEEENLIDRYAPFVAHQNQSSLGVTSEHLSMLTPMDERTSMGNDDSTGGNEALGSQLENDEIVSDLDDGNEQHLSDSFVTEPTADLSEEDAAPNSTHPGNAAEKAIHWAISNETFAETSELEESAELVDESEHAEARVDASAIESEESETADETESVAATPASKPNVHEHMSEASSSEIQQQAEAILRRLNGSQGVSCETNTDVNSNLSQTGEPNSSSDSDAEFERQNAALDESQQILNEILHQKNELAQARETTIRSFTEPSKRSTPTVQIEYPTAAKEDGDVPQDDREMIIINRMEEPAEKNDQTENAVPFPSTPISTGRAERMDYQKLFNQLRDISNPQD